MSYAEVRWLVAPSLVAELFEWDRESGSEDDAEFSRRHPPEMEPVDEEGDE